MAESEAELNKLRVVDLKQRLSELDLSVAGLKADLVERLYQHLCSNNEAGNEGEDEKMKKKEEVEEEEKDDGNRIEQEPVELPAPQPAQKLEDGSKMESTDNVVAPVSPVPIAVQQPAVLPPITGDGSPTPGLSSPPPAAPVAAPVAAAAAPPPLLVLPAGVTPCQPPSHIQLLPPKVIPPLMPQGPPPTPLLSGVAIATKPPGLEHDALMQHKVRQQQILLEQQKKSQKQEDLFRLQQLAMMEKQKEENEKQARLLCLQQEALKQNENEQKQLQALGLKPPVVVGGGGTAASNEEEEDLSSGCKSGVAGVGALMAALQQRQQPPPPSSAAAAPLPPANSFMGPRPPLAPSMAGPPLRPMGLQTRPQGQVGLMGHSPIRQEKPIAGGDSLTRGGVTGRDMRHHGSDAPQGLRQTSLRQQGGRGGEDNPPALMSLQVSAPKEDPKDVRLPQALEEALAYKHQRAKQVGVTLEEEDHLHQHNGEESEDASDEGEDDERAEDALQFNEWMPASSEMEWSAASPAMAAPARGISSDQQHDEADEEDEGQDEDEEDEEDDDDEEELQRNREIVATKFKKDKLKKKKKKKKKRKAKHGGGKTWIQKQLEEERIKKEEISSKKSKSSESKIEVSYIQEEIVLDYSDPMHRHFAKIFENFKISEPLPPPEEAKIEEKIESTPVSIISGLDLKKVPKLAEDPQDDSDDEDDGKPKISKRKLKLLRRMSIAELKQTVNRPDVVEMHDVTARDPKLLVHLKATRNTVPVPRHWCFKRKYLQGKRGIEKPPFELPDFIKRTGIMEMRAALQEKEDQKTLKAKMRDKVRPKMGKIDIDYQKLHDAFFKWQCKPEMTVHGDLYYEGKEFETKMKDKKPGEMSDDLRIALGMPVGANAHKVPPPWLIAMQRYGPPPSYPNLKIPGLNAPIPDSCSFGYHAGGWGKPPVDNMGKPIYGDVFGTQNKENEMPMVEEEVEKSLWGELESESEEESEEEESSEEEEDTSGLVTPGETGLVTPSGISSLPAGLETPDMIELRKKHLETEMEGGETPALYTILPEKRVEGGGRAMMASTHTYDMSSAGSARAANQGVEVALDPSELDLVDTDAMAARYEATLREQQAGEEEDFSDMVAEHAAKQRNKRRRLQHQEQNKPAKKYKDFKF